LKVEAFERPLSIRSVRDGGLYLVPEASFVQTNLFLKIVCVENVYLKVPSERGIEDYRRFIKGEESVSGELRPLEDAERFSRLHETLESFPELKPLTRISSDLAHYVAVHKLQYERLRKQTAVQIPEARFGALCSVRHKILRRFEPLMLQARIPGTTLWKMFDFSALQVLPAWRPFLPTISARLSELLSSPLVNHIDWNIQNFVFDETAESLFYVDLKPTTFISRVSNEHNLKGIRDYFVV
jgi:hypothetical protein